MVTIFVFCLVGVYTIINSTLPDIGQQGYQELTIHEAARKNDALQVRNLLLTSTADGVSRAFGKTDE
eukprot:m.123524 g.123524  ORF g.123524 m.123524 type:complete len:67 (-) comp13754_c0_seq12:2863-3063(-)